VTTDEQSLELLRAEAANQRARLALYRARLYAQRATSLPRLRELERAAAGASERLRRAERTHQQDASEHSPARDDTT
jgi:multidrug resistance efflux pump